MTSLSWPTAFPVLSDGTITLRAWRAEDAEAVLTACQDAEVQRWMDVPVPFLAEHAEAFIVERAQRWASHTGVGFAITEDQRVLGTCGLVAIDQDDRVAEVIWALSPEARGQKVAQRAGRLLCHWGLRDLGLARLEFYIDPANTASRAVAERVGAAFEGILASKTVIRGTRRDCALYALLAPDA